MNTVLQYAQQVSRSANFQATEIIQFVFCSSMNKRSVLPLMNTQWRQITVKQRQHGTNHLL